MNSAVLKRSISFILDHTFGCLCNSLVGVSKDVHCSGGEALWHLEDVDDEGAAAQHVHGGNSELSGGIGSAC